MTGDINGSTVRVTNPRAAHIDATGVVGRARHARVIDFGEHDTLYGDPDYIVEPLYYVDVVNVGEAYKTTGKAFSRNELEVID